LEYSCLRGWIQKNCCQKKHKFFVNYVLKAEYKPAPNLWCGFLFSIIITVFHRINSVSTIFFQIAMKKLLPLVSFIILNATSFEKTYIFLTHSRTYTVVSHAPISMKNENRTGTIFYFTSSARTYEEQAQTALLAAFELYKANKDPTS
jgi:hypothetical protein